MAHADHTRDPCPYVILNDFGGAFAMGAVGGSIWHGIKGARNSPRVSGTCVFRSRSKLDVHHFLGLFIS
jgi:hypothetical protein